MGKANRTRKLEMAELNKWFEEFSVACPGKYPMKDKLFCGMTFIPHPKKMQAQECLLTNCTPLYMANRLIQMTFGPRIYEPHRNPGKKTD